MNKPLRTYVILLVVVFSASLAIACRFTVRDIGFVELRGPEYSLVATLVGQPKLAGPTNLADSDSSSVDDNLKPSLLPPLDSWLAELRRKLSDSNIQLTVRQPASEPVGDKAAAAEEAEQEGQRIANLRLIGRDGRSLELTDTLPSLITATGSTNLNSTNLNSTNQSSANQNTAKPETTVDEWLSKTLFSETLDELGHAAINSFVQIVVIDGKDSAGNLAARQVAEQAVQAIRKIEPMLPRPIAFPVRVRHIEFSQRQSEEILLWAAQGSAVSSRDVAEQLAPTSTEDTSLPILMVLYGRGRLAGPAMSGSAIELRETLAQLALVGESCECETDRAWMDERVLPFRWSSELRQQAANSLGFDPDSPLVQAEMTRIVSQGFNSARTARKNSDGGDAIERLLLGYAEAMLTPYASDESGPSSHTTTPETGALSPVRAQVVAGDGWDFEEPTSQAEKKFEKADATEDADISNVSSVPNAASAPAGGQALTRPSGSASPTANHPLGDAKKSSEAGYITHSTTTTSGFSFSLSAPIGITLGALFFLVFVCGLLLMGRKR